MFSYLYRKTLAWAQHDNAPYYLAGLSFAESSFFPIPPDVMLIPMALSQPERALKFALLATLMSVLGGVLGYCIGYFAFTTLEPWLQQSTHYWTAYLSATEWFALWGIWAIFLAAFSPIPYKVFTIAAGVLTMGLLPFVLVSLLGRGLRFFLVASLLAWGGARLQGMLSSYIDRIGWAMVAIVGMAIMIYYQ